MLKMHLRQPGFTYSACWAFTKNKERIKNLKKKEIQDIFIKIKYKKFVFNMIWLMEIEDFKDSNRRTATNKILRDRVFNIVENPKADGY